MAAELVGSAVAEDLTYSAVVHPTARKVIMCSSVECFLLVLCLCKLW